MFVEGHTEKKALPAFLRRWLDARVDPRVGVQSVQFEGWSNYVDEIAKKVNLNLSGHAGADALGAIGLLDLYGPTFFPQNVEGVGARYEWAKRWLETKVGNPRFRQHFAVHETEAWLLSEPSVLPTSVANALPPKCQRPESVNFASPPASLLDDLYRRHVNRPYRKITDGSNLFADLDPAVAASKCPYLATLLDEMLAVARRTV